MSQGVSCKSKFDAYKKACFNIALLSYRQASGPQVQTYKITVYHAMGVQDAIID